MNRIAVCTAVWKRPEVFQIWLNCWLSLEPKPFIVVTGSKDDGCREIAEQYPDDVAYFEMPNKPVGAKWNESHVRAKGTCDYFLTTGSDDVMDQAMWDFYTSFTGERLTLKDLYFYDIPSKKAIFWKGYEKKSAYFGLPIGAHQLTRHDVMEKLNFRPFQDTTMAHEHHTEKKLKAIGIKSLVIPMELTGGIGVDLKSKNSYSPFKLFSNSEYIPISELSKKSPELIKIITE